MGVQYIPPSKNKAEQISVRDDKNNYKNKNLEGILDEVATQIKTEKARISNIDDDNNSDTMTYSSSKIEGKFDAVNTQFQTMANYSLIKHTDGLLYIKKQDGTLIGTGVETGNNVDLSTLTMNISGQTLTFKNGTTILSSVTIPTVTVTDDQLKNIIKGYIDSGTLSALSIGDGSISLNKMVSTDEKNLAGKITFTNVLINQNDGTETTAAAYQWSTDYLELNAGSEYVLSDSSFNYSGTWFFRGAYYNENKAFTEGIVSATSITCNGTTKKYVRFTVDRRSILIDTPSKMFFGKKEDMLIRIEKQQFHLPTVNRKYYTGGVTADSLDEKTVLPIKIKKEVVSNKNLINSILYLNSNNLLNEQNLQLKSTIRTDGTIGATNASTGVIDVEFIEPNIKYTLTTGSYVINTAWWLDEFKNPLQNLNISTSISQQTYTSCEGAYYLRVQTNYSNRPSTPTSGNLKVCKGDMLLTGNYNEEYLIKSNYLPGAKGNKDWSNYKYVAIGDSRTVGYSNNMNDSNGNKIWDIDVAENYPAFIKYYTNIQLTNKASTGAAFCVRSAVTDIPTMFEQAQNLPPDTDIITIFGMSNDRIINVTHPNYNPTNERDNLENKYDTSTFKGAVRQTIKNIQLQCPSATIIFLVEEDEAYDKGQSKKDMIEEICKLHKIPVLNLTRCSMTGTECNEYLAQKYQNYTDGLHESVIGHKHMARAVAGEMSKYLW